MSKECDKCQRHCTSACQFHRDYWKASAKRCAEFLLEKFEHRVCDCEAFSHCIRCNVVAQSRRMLDVLASTEEAELVNSLFEMVEVNCHALTPFHYDSGALSDKARAMRLLAKHGKLDIEHEKYRRVLARDFRMKNKQFRERAERACAIVEKEDSPQLPTEQEPTCSYCGKPYVTVVSCADASGREIGPRLVCQECRGLHEF